MLAGSYAKSTMDCAGTRRAARLPKHLQTPGLYDVMRVRGGAKLARMSDTALSDILKNWGFKSKSLGNSRGWEAPQLIDLRKSIRDKFSAVEFDDRKEWIVDGERASKTR